MYLYECDCKHGINSKLTQPHWINLMLNLTLILLKYMSCPTFDMQCTSAFSRYLQYILFEYTKPYQYIYHDNTQYNN